MKRPEKMPRHLVYAQFNWLYKRDLARFIGRHKTRDAATQTAAAPTPAVAAPQVQVMADATRELAARIIADQSKHLSVLLERYPSLTTAVDPAVAKKLVKALAGA